MRHVPSATARAKRGMGCRCGVSGNPDTRKPDYSNDANQSFVKFRCRAGGLVTSQVQIGAKTIRKAGPELLTEPT